MLNHFVPSFKHSIEITKATFVPFFKRHGLLVLVAVVIFVLLEEWNLKFLQLAAAQGQEGLLTRVAMVINSIVLSLFFALIVPVGIHFPSLTSSQVFALIGNKALPLTVEGLRMLVPILLGYLLIAPGIYFQLVYTFVFFVVLFDPKYGQTPEFDALKTSKTLSKGVLAPLFLLLLLSFAAETAMTFWGGKSSFITDPIGSFTMTGLKVALYFIFPTMNYGLYTYKRGLK